MKVLCPSCDRLVELVDLRVERGALVVRCPSCQSEQRQPLPGAALGARPASRDDDDENDEGPTIILLTPEAGGGAPVPLAIAPPGSAVPPPRPAPIARFEPAPVREVPAPAPLPPSTQPPAIAPLRPAVSGPHPVVARPATTGPHPVVARPATTGPHPVVAPAQAVDAEFAQLLTNLDGVHPPRKPGAAAQGGGVSPAPAGPVRGSTIQLPPGHCPKCIAPRTRESVLCPACGLVFANFRAEEHQPSAALESAWHGLEGRWDRAEEHEKFLQLAFNLDELAKAGRLYRIVLARAPEDVQAKTALEGMVRMASTAAAMAARTDPAELAKRRRKVLAVSAMVFLFIPMAALLANLLLRAH